MAMQADIQAFAPDMPSCLFSYIAAWKKKLYVCNFSMNSIWLKLCSMPNNFSYVLVCVKLGYDILVYHVILKL